MILSRAHFIGFAIIVLVFTVPTLHAHAHPDVISITEQDNIPTLKRSVIVKLAGEVSLEKLEKIGSIIRNEDAGYDRIFIEYYLPGMKEGSGAWGITHWTPNKDVRIFGNVQRFDHLTEAEANEALSIEYLQIDDVAALLSNKDFLERKEASWASVSCKGVKGTDELYQPYRSIDPETRETWDKASFVWNTRQTKAEADGREFNCDVTKKYLESSWLVVTAD